MKPSRMSWEVRLGRNGVFSVRLWPTLITAILFCVLVGLGTWQVQRLQWKQDLLRQIDTRIHQTPVDAVSVADPVHSEYLPIYTTGTFAPGQELHLHAISLKGEAGYHILMPLRLSADRYLLVDRGFVPMDRLDPQTRQEGENYSQQTITGLLRLPRHHWMQPKNHPETNDWYGYDLQTTAETLGLPKFLPFILEAGATPKDGGYPIGGQTRLEITNNHFVYSIIWYSLAAALLVIYGVQGYRKVT